MTVSSSRLCVVILLAWCLPQGVQGAYLATHGQTARDYQEWVKKVSAAGYRVAFVDGSDGGSEARFAAVALPSNGVPWEARHDLSAEQYQKTFTELTGKGYRLTCVSGYANGAAPHFAAVWVKDGKKIGWEAAHDLTAAAYQERVTALERKGLRPTCVSGYGDGSGSYRFAVLFVQAGTPWVARHDLTAEQYQKAFNEFTPQGYRPDSVSVYNTPGGVRYAVVFVKDGHGYQARHNLSAEDYQAEFDRQAKQGLRPLLVVGCGEGKPAGPEAYDEAMRTYMKERSIPAGSLVVSRDGRTLLARGYGFADAEGKRAVRPEDPFRLASVTKPITTAAVRELIREGKLSDDTKVFPLLGWQPPPGQKADPRLNTITVRHLLDHKGGWDRDKAGDPMFRSLEIAAALGKPGPAEADDVVRYMIGQPLQFDPGSRSVYSNFGYCVLGRVIEKVTGEKYPAYVRRKILAPLKIESVELGRSLPRQRNPREPIYLDPGKGPNVVRPDAKEPVPAPDGTFYLEAMDAHGGLIGSAVDLDRFLRAYWISGERRKGNGEAWTFFGSLPGTYTMVMQRANGVNITALFNQRTDPSGLDYGKIGDLLSGIADRDGSGSLRYAAVWVKDE